MDRLAEKIGIWVVAANITVRSRLREVLNNTFTKGTITNFTNLKSFDTAIASEELPVIIIVTRSMGIEQILRIAELLRGDGTKKIKTKLVVAIDGRGHLESSVVVKLYLAGIHGFISEPFSIQDVQLLLGTLFSKEGLSNVQDRTHHSAVYVLNDSMQYIDQIASKLLNGEEIPLASQRELKKINKTLLELKKQNVAEYNRALIDAFSAVPPPKKKESTRNIRNKKDSIQKLLHPGHAIKATIAKRKLEHNAIARLMRITEEELIALIEGKADLTKELAESVARALGRSPQEWFSMQEQYNKQQAAKDKKKKS